MATIEFNLVQVEQMYEPIYDLIKRVRLQTDHTDLELANKAFEFIKENISELERVIPDKDFLNNLLEINTKINITDLYSLKYLMATHGVDLIIYAVSSNEINREEVPLDKLEYNIIDHNWYQKSFVPVASKFLVDKLTPDMLKVYEEIETLYTPFKKEIFGKENPLRPILNSIKESKDLLGKSSDSNYHYVNTLFDYLGKKISIIRVK